MQTAAQKQTTEESRYNAELEPELIEGDGRLPVWMWAIVVWIILFAVLLSPFEVIWPK